MVLKYLFYDKIVKSFQKNVKFLLKMAQIGNKQNSFLNGEWAKHVRRYAKKLTSKKRRSLNKIVLYERHTTDANSGHRHHKRM